MKACVFTLGCKMNEAESESVMRALEDAGLEVTDELGFADYYFLNTCAVTAEAERKSRQAVSRILKFNPIAKIVVFGCAAEHGAQAFEGREQVLFVSGAQRKDKIVSRFLEEERGVFLERETSFAPMPFPKRTKTRAFLRIQDGCNNFCSYCLIPYLRGRTRSRGVESIVEEARSTSAKEIVLTGIDISSYRDGEKTLGDLLLSLKGLNARIRLGSLEAGVIDRPFLEKIKSAGNVCEHFHLSLQSGSTSVLRAMNRRYTREEYLAKCALIYEYFPDCAITTDLIAGFPTETEEDFLSSLSIIQEARLARVHAFPYSPREGTNAYRMKDLPAPLKKERCALLIAEGRRAEEEYLTRFVGREAAALFEEDGGYTSNYIRVYAPSAAEGKEYRVKLIKRERDGLSAQIIEEI